MATLSTIDGLQFLVDPSEIALVADHDVETGVAVTVVYGLTSTGLRISESVDGLLARLNLTAKFAKLTRPNGTTIWVNAKAVKVARQPMAGEYAPAVRSVLSIGDIQQGVTEALNDTGVEIRSHGGSL